LIDVIGELSKKQESLRKVFNADITILEEEITKIENLILEELQVPKDNTLEKLEEYGDPEGYDHEDSFCRDFINDWFFEYSTGKMTKEKLIFNLFNWNSNWEKLLNEFI
jgi:hypothetical protein